METLTIKDIFGKARELSGEKQDQFLMDLPFNHLKCLELVAMMYDLDEIDPELFGKIKRMNLSRQTAISPDESFTGGTIQTPQR